MKCPHCDWVDPDGELRCVSCDSLVKVFDPAVRERKTFVLPVVHDPEYPIMALNPDVANFLDKCGKNVRMTLEVIPGDERNSSAD